LDQIDGPAQQPFKCFFQAEIGLERPRIRGIPIKFDQQVYVTEVRLEVTTSRGAKQVQPTYVKAPAKGLHFIAMAGNGVDHVGFDQNWAVYHRLVASGEIGRLEAGPPRRLIRPRRKPWRLTHSPLRVRVPTLSTPRSRSACSTATKRARAKSTTSWSRRVGP